MSGVLILFMDVKQIQSALNDGGYGPIEQDGKFGNETRDAVRRFQVDKGIHVDGEVGPETLITLGKISVTTRWPSDVKIDVIPIVPKANSLSGVALEIAIAQNGVREFGNNAGPAVQAFLQSVSLGPGYSWCMAFVYWAFDNASMYLKVINPLVKTGGCLRQLNEIDPKYVVKGDPRQGDIFIMDLGGGSGHTGIVVSRDRDNVQTIEGNTNNNGSANGDGVYMRTRSINRIAAFIRV